MEVDTGPACMTCAYSGVDYRLECRIKPPSPDYKSGGRMFPFVKPNDWCSKYKAKEEPKPEPKPEPKLDERFEQMLEDWKEE